MDWAGIELGIRIVLEVVLTAAAVTYLVSGTL